MHYATSDLRPVSSWSLHMVGSAFYTRHMETPRSHRAIYYPRDLGLFSKHSASSYTTQHHPIILTREKRKLSKSEFPNAPSLKKWVEASSGIQSPLQSQVLSSWWPGPVTAYFIVSWHAVNLNALAITSLAYVHISEQIMPYVPPVIPSGSHCN